MPMTFKEFQSNLWNWEQLTFAKKGWDARDPEIAVMREQLATLNAQAAGFAGEVVSLRAQLADQKEALHDQMGWMKPDEVETFVKVKVTEALELLHQEYEHCECEYGMCFIAAAIARNRAAVGG